MDCQSRLSDDIGLSDIRSLASGKNMSCLNDEMKRKDSDLRLLILLISDFNLKNSNF